MKKLILFAGFVILSASVSAQQNVIPPPASLYQPVTNAYNPLEQLMKIQQYKQAQQDLINSQQQLENLQLQNRIARQNYEAGIVQQQTIQQASQHVDRDTADCRGYSGPGGACSYGPGDGLAEGPGGGLCSGPGGGLYAGPGGGLYAGPGGGMYAGPGGGLYAGPGGGMYAGPGGGIYAGPGGYRGAWSPCITGAKGKEWSKQNCPM